MDVIITPMMRHEMRVRVLDWRTFAAITLDLAVLSTVAGVSLLLGKPAAGDSPGRLLFDRLAFAQLALVLVMVPALAAGAISNDRRRGTWDVLLLTPLSSVSIVLGKLVTLIALSLVLLMLGGPIIGIAFLYRDMSASTLVPVYAIIAGTSVLLSCLALALSALAGRSRIAAPLSLVVSLLWSFGWGILLFRGWPGLTPGGATVRALPAPGVANPFAALNVELPDGTAQIALPFGWAPWGAYLCVAGMVALVAVILSVLSVGPHRRFVERA